MFSTEIFQVPANDFRFNERFTHSINNNCFRVHREMFSHKREVFNYSFDEKYAELELITIVNKCLLSGEFRGCGRIYSNSN